MTSERNIELNNREEGTREKNTIKVVELELDEIFEQFNENITDIKTKFNIADKLLTEDNEEGCKDIWRSQIVFLDSALDYYIHCITKYGMNKIFKGDWNTTNKYGNFMVPLKKVEYAIKNSEDTTWFVELISKSYANDTFMDFNSVRSQLNLININIHDIADDAFYEEGSAQKTNDKLKQFLNKLFHRRNAIAHQSDRRHQDGVKQEINKDEVELYIDYVEKIVTSIQNKIKNKNAKE